MGVYQNGSAPTITETFGYETTPGDFTTFVAADPAEVFFYFRDPDNTINIYEFGVAAELTNPSVGVYVLAPGVLSLAGQWFYRAEGNDIGPDHLCAVIEGELTILPSSVLLPDVSEPVNGPCQVWCDPTDVIDCSDLDLTSDLSILEDACASASEILYDLSGRQYSGRCAPVTVRPCANGCSCWPASDLFPGLSPGAPQFPVGGWGWWAGSGWGWGWNDVGCGCGCESRALLPGYPVTSIVEVKIDGDVLDEDEYRLDEYRWLTRMADADGQAQFWPGCQRLDRPDTEPGTWSVTYIHGVTPPISGKRAAAQLAGEIYKACTGGNCALPAGTTQVTRTGITVVKAPFIAWGRINGHWATGLTLVDMFLSARNPAGLKRRPISWSAGRSAVYARRVGT